MSSEHEGTAPPEAWLRALHGLGAGAACGASLGLLDVLRCSIEGHTVLPGSLYVTAVLVYAVVFGVPGALAAVALRPGTATALTVCGAAAVGLGLYANYRWLPAFTDPRSLAADGAIVAAALIVAAVLARRWRPMTLRCGGVSTFTVGLCLAAAGVLALGTSGGEGPEPRVKRIEGAVGRRPDVLLLCIDTLRADALGFLGGESAATTPHLDALAAEGRAGVALATSSWTKPSTASLLTGLYPTEHGALGFESVLSPEAVTLAEMLRAAGYRTAAWSDNPFVSPEFGFAQGFDRFSGRSPNPLMRGTLLLRVVGQLRLRIAGGAAYSFGPGIDLGAERLMGESVDFLLAEDERPAFAYVHLIEPHFPYTPPPPHDGGRRRVDPPHSAGLLPFDAFPGLPDDDLAVMKANYLGEVAYVDAVIGAAVARLREAGRLDTTMLVITSDHGEEFHEHGGWTHGQSLYDELVRVPLVIRSARTVKRPVRIPEDRMPSLCHVPLYVLAEAQVEGGAFGRARAPGGGDLGAGGDYAVFSELEAGPCSARSAALMGKRVIVSRKMDEERVEFVGEGLDEEDRARLLRLLDKGFLGMEENALERRSGHVSDDTREALKAIGYTGGDGDEGR